MINHMNWNRININTLIITLQQKKTHERLIFGKKRLEGNGHKGIRNITVTEWQ